MKLLKRCLSVFCVICVLCTANISSVNAEESYMPMIKEVVKLVNDQRAAVGADPLILNDKLVEAAMIRAEEATEKFSHTRPDGSDCFTIIDEMEIGWMARGENIAGGHSTPAATVNQWVNSEGHYKNMIDPYYSEIGVGIAYDPDSLYGWYWVQLFIKPTEPVTPPQYKSTDVNQDGEVNASDLAIVQDFLFDNGMEYSYYMPDVNESGNVDVFDWIMIKREILYC